MVYLHAWALRMCSKKLPGAIMQRMAISTECGSPVSCRAQAAEDCAAPAALGGVSSCDSRAEELFGLKQAHVLCPGFR